MICFFFFLSKPPLIHTVYWSTAAFFVLDRMAKYPQCPGYPRGFDVKHQKQQQ